MTDTNLWLAVLEDMKQVFDAADGLRADLARRGYSPTAQEQIAMQFITVALSHSART
jgi:hypothetical protein